MLGVIMGAGNLSKGVVATHRRLRRVFAKMNTVLISFPYRFELKPREILMQWLDRVTNQPLD